MQALETSNLRWTSERGDEWTAHWLTENTLPIGYAIEDPDEWRFCPSQSNLPPQHRFGGTLFGEFAPTKIEPPRSRHLKHLAELVNYLSLMTEHEMALTLNLQCAEFFINGHPRPGSLDLLEVATSFERQSLRCQWLHPTARHPHGQARFYVIQSDGAHTEDPDIIREARVKALMPFAADYKPTGCS